MNPGHKPNSLSQCISVCHWNLNSISVHIFAKVSLLSTYISVNKVDTICRYKSYLKSQTLSDDGNLKISGSYFIRKHHPSDSYPRGICVYYKKSLPFKVTNVKSYLCNAFHLN